MSCKVRLYFYDSNSGKDVFDEECKLKVNGDDVAIGIFEPKERETELKFSLSTAIPGNGGYEFDKWSFSQTGVSFTPTNTETLTQNVAEVPYLEVRCCLKPKTNPQPAKIIYNPNNGQNLIEQNVMFNDPATRLIDAPSYTYLYEDPVTHNTKKVIAVFAGWSTTETVEGADSITDEYTPGVAYEKYKKVWKVDFNGVKVYYQATEEMLSVKDPARPDVLVNTSWDDVKDYMFRLGANGAITYAALARYTPRALSTTMEAVWRRPTDPEDSSFLYPQGEIIYTDGPGEDANVIGRETAFGGVDVKTGDDGDFKGIAFDEWTDKSGKKVKKGSTIKTPSGGGGWSMHFHVSMAVNRKFWVRYDTRGGKPTIEPELITLEDGQMSKEYTVKGPLPKKKGIKPGEEISAVCWLSGGSSYLPNNKVELNGDTTFVADYSQNKEVEVNFTTTGGNGTYTVTPKTKKFNVGTDSYEFPDVKGSDGTTPTIEKWTTGTDKKIVGGPDYEAKVVTNPKNHTVTAHLKPMKTVMLDPNGGKIWIGGKSYTTPHAYKIAVTPGVKTDALPPFSAEREGYTDADYKGWFMSGAMDAKTQYDPNDKKNANTNTIKVYVKWAQKVTFEANGGVYKEEPTRAHGYFAGETYAALPTEEGGDITRKDYQFAGWYTKADGGDQISEGAKVTTTARRTLYAHWDSSVQTVTFNPHGGTLNTTSLRYPIGDGKTYSSPKFPTPTYVDSEGNPTFGFRGWYTAETGGDLVQGEDAVTNESTRTLHAQYNRQKKVMFYAGDGYFTGPDGMHYSEEMYFKVGEDYGKGAVDKEGKPIDNYTFPQPSRDGGWSFKGWWTDKTSGTQVKETDTAVGTGNLLLYAHWENDKEVATLTYDYNGGVRYVPGKDVWEGDKAGALLLPRKDGEAFTGWHKQGVALAMAKRDSGDVSGPLVTATTIIDGSMTLKASWSKKIFLYYAVAPQGN